MALLSAQSLQKQGHRVMLYTLEHDPDCFPELQEGLTIVTARTTQSIQNTKYKVQNGEERQNTQYKIHSE
jgi:hypothetical protein